MRRWITVSLIGMLASAVLALGASTPAIATPVRPSEEMSDAQAAKVYLKTVCAVLPSARGYSGIWGSRKTITVAEVRGRLPELRKLSLAYGKALQAEARHLFNPPADWPASVAPHVQKFAASVARQATNRSGQGYASSAAEWIRYAAAGNRAANSYGAQPAIIRATLGLPGPGKGC